MIRDDAANREAIELYLLANANASVMQIIERIAERLRLFTQSQSATPSRGPGLPAQVSPNPPRPAPGGIIKTEKDNR